MKKNTCSKILSFVLVLQMIMLIMSPSAFAAKPGGGAPTKPLINSGAASVNLQVESNLNVSTSLTANMALNWKSTLPSKGVIAFSSITSTSATTLTYTPNTGASGTDTFIVTGSDPRNSKSKDTITINITIIPRAPIELNYVALGDSIATGTVSPFEKIDTYVKYFYNYLVQTNPDKTVTVQNLSHDGDRSNELLTKLNTDSTIIAAVQNAEVITVSIGGNNLMQAAKNWLGLYDFFNINTSMAEQGAADFNTQWPLIVSRLKELNPNGKIIINTVYNPYNQADSNGDANAYMHNLVNGYLYANGTGINDLILYHSNNGSNYSVANIYNEYLPYSQTNTIGTIVYLYPDSLTRNPHPRYAGQQLITNLVKSAYINN